jgi:hypothetical protein
MKGIPRVIDIVNDSVNDIVYDSVNDLVNDSDVNTPIEIGKFVKNGNNDIFYELFEKRIISLFCKKTTYPTVSKEFMKLIMDHMNDIKSVSLMKFFFETLSKNLPKKKMSAILNNIYFIGSNKINFKEAIVIFLVNNGVTLFEKTYIKKPSVNYEKIIYEFDKIVIDQKKMIERYFNTENIEKNIKLIIENLDMYNNIRNTISKKCDMDIKNPINAYIFDELFIASIPYNFYLEYFDEYFKHIDKSLLKQSLSSDDQLFDIENQIKKHICKRLRNRCFYFKFIMMFHNNGFSFDINKMSTLERLTFFINCVKSADIGENEDLFLLLELNEKNQCLEKYKRELIHIMQINFFMKNKTYNYGPETLKFTYGKKLCCKFLIDNIDILIDDEISSLLILSSPNIDAITEYTNKMKSLGFNMKEKFNNDVTNLSTIQLYTKQFDWFGAVFPINCITDDDDDKSSAYDEFLSEEDNDPVDNYVYDEEEDGVVFHDDTEDVPDDYDTDDDDDVVVEKTEEIVKDPTEMLFVFISNMLKNANRTYIMGNPNWYNTPYYAEHNRFQRSRFNYKHFNIIDLQYGINIYNTISVTSTEFIMDNFVSEQNQLLLSYATIISALTSHDVCEYVQIEKIFDQCFILNNKTIFEKLKFNGAKDDEPPKVVRSSKDDEPPKVVRSSLDDEPPKVVRSSLDDEIEKIMGKTFLLYSLIKKNKREQFAEYVIDHDYKRELWDFLELNYRSLTIIYKVTGPFKNLLLLSMYFNNYDAFDVILEFIEDYHEEKVNLGSILYNSRSETDLQIVRELEYVDMFFIVNIFKNHELDIYNKNNIFLKIAIKDLFFNSYDALPTFGAPEDYEPRKLGRSSLEDEKNIKYYLTNLFSSYEEFTNFIDYYYGEDISFRGDYHNADTIELIEKYDMILRNYYLINEPLEMSSMTCLLISRHIIFDKDFNDHDIKIFKYFYSKYGNNLLKYLHDNMLLTTVEYYSQLVNKSKNNIPIISGIKYFTTKHIINSLHFFLLKDKNLFNSIIDLIYF